MKAHIDKQTFEFNEKSLEIYNQYIENLENSLSADPNKKEIVEDINSRIAELINETGKEEVTEEKINSIIKRIGEVKEITKESPKKESFFSKNKKILIIVGILIALFLCVIPGVLATVLVVRTGKTVQDTMSKPFQMFETITDKMFNRYNDQVDESLDQYNEQSEDMLNDFKEKSDQLKKEYDESKEEMLNNNDFENDIEQQYQEELDRLEQEYNNAL